MAIQESGICTDLPFSEASFDSEHKQASTSLAEAMSEGGASNIPSSFSGVILATTLLAREYAHIQQSAHFDHTQKGNIESFWDRHREIDYSLSNTLLHLPEHFRVAHELRDPNAIFLGIALHAATICLHRAAISKAMRFQFESDIVTQSIARCTIAAHAITSTIRLVSYQDISRMNPWTGFCLYLAGLVYCHSLGPGHLPNRDDISNAAFLLTIMKVIGTTYPITEYFSAQLELEMDVVQRNRIYKRRTDRPKSSHEYHDPNDLSSWVRISGMQTQFWRLLSAEERANLSRKVLSSKTWEGILVLNFDKLLAQG